MEQPRLKAQHDKLTALADDLDDMQGYLDKQVKRMDEIVDSIEAGWRGPSATAYRALHRGAAEDAVRIRMVMQRLEQAVRLSRRLLAAGPRHHGAPASGPGRGGRGRRGAPALHTEPGGS
ncbi:WXG100 family type VII secretion target [Streptomyces sp. 5K101]|uniref:WXG100 family type VII secretion target n=1 Tax=Streptomyces sp. 5K101 TaxID=3390037 RepID=UPI00397609A0